jgi:hypothetical protein
MVVWMNWNGYGSSNALTKVLFWHLPAGTEEKHKNLPEELVPWPRFRFSPENYS